MIWLWLGGGPTHVETFDPKMTARRLCEAGCGFVTVTYGGWDMHGNIANSMKGRSPQLDPAIAALVEDIHQRGQDKNILFVVTGEFGRTPKVKRNAGREHWAPLSTLALAGGGLNMGQVVGESARKVDVPKSPPIRPRDLMATVFQMLARACGAIRQPGRPPGRVAMNCYQGHVGVLGDSPLGVPVGNLLAPKKLVDEKVLQEGRHAGPAALRTGRRRHLPAARNDRFRGSPATLAEAEAFRLVSAAEHRLCGVPSQRGWSGPSGYPPGPIATSRTIRLCARSSPRADRSDSNPLVGKVKVQTAQVDDTAQLFLGLRC